MWNSSLIIWIANVSDLSVYPKGQIKNESTLWYFVSPLCWTTKSFGPHQDCCDGKDWLAHCPVQLFPASTSWEIWIQLQVTVLGNSRLWSVNLWWDDPQLRVGKRSKLECVTDSDRGNSHHLPGLLQLRQVCTREPSLWWDIFDVQCNKHYFVSRNVEQNSLGMECWLEFASLACKCERPLGQDAWSIMFLILSTKCLHALKCFNCNNDTKVSPTHNLLCLSTRIMDSRQCLRAPRSELQGRQPDLPGVGRGVQGCLRGTGPMWAVGSLRGPLPVLDDNAWLH